MTQQQVNNLVVLHINQTLADSQHVDSEVEEFMNGRSTICQHYPSLLLFTPLPAVPGSILAFNNWFMYSNINILHNTSRP